MAAASILPRPCSNAWQPRFEPDPRAVEEVGEHSIVTNNECELNQLSVVVVLRENLPSRIGDGVTVVELIDGSQQACFEIVTVPRGERPYAIDVLARHATGKSSQHMLPPLVRRFPTLRGAQD